MTERGIGGTQRVYLSWCDEIFACNPKVFLTLKDFEDYFSDYMGEVPTVEDAMNEGLLGYHITEVIGT